MRNRAMISAVIVVSLAASIQAAFIVEPHSSGLGFSNFAGAPSYSASAGTAPGLTATHSAFGGTSPDVYVYSYTPGVDNDNWIVPVDNRYFGNGLYSTNLQGGQTGYYNVYITWLSSTNVDLAGCNIDITHDGGTTSWTNVNGNDGGTNAIAESWGPFPVGTVITGANNKWLKIADQVLLTAGDTYTVTQTANNESYVSMRSSGVMWEFVSTPEPATLTLLAVGGIFLRRCK